MKDREEKGHAKSDALAEQESFDAIAECRWCGAFCHTGLEHCTECGAKLTRDKTADVPDLVDVLAWNYGHRVSGWLWLSGAMFDAEVARDVYDYTFRGADEPAG